jgi:pantetheine-phosphate adenylyltransferase
MKTALFTGTFDPFTIGHASIVRRALKLFDNVVIGVADSKGKQTEEDLEKRRAAVSKYYADNQHVKVVAYSDLTVDLAKRENADCIVRGIRSIKDYEYEREQSDINSRLGGIETVFFIAEPELSYVSSSMIRELESFGKDISDYIPDNKKQKDI